MHRWMITVRSLARKMGMTGLINRVCPATSYESRVYEALTGAVEPGDVVWDVGANVGVYSALLCERVGRDGRVIAFEPFPEACDRIRERMPNCDWLQVENVALGDADTAGRLVTGPKSVENHVETETDKREGNVGSIPIRICRGDTMCDRLGQVPNVVKVDVEGFEEEVLEGMGKMLTYSDLRSILVEVHFMKLEKRGQPMAPLRIEKLLGAKGFKTNWVDASHLFATR